MSFNIATGPSLSDENNNDICAKDDFTIDEFIDLYMPAGHALDRLCHVRYLGTAPYWRVEIMNSRGGIVVGAGPTIEDAFKSAKENVNGDG